jgi:hypothetical protein
MSEKEQGQAQEAQIAPEYIIEELLNQNKELTRKAAYQVAINLQLQEENKKFINYAAQLEELNKDLMERLEKLEDKYTKERAKTAGPVPVKAEKEPEIIDAEPGE